MFATTFSTSALTTLRLSKDIMFSQDFTELGQHLHHSLEGSDHCRDLKEEETIARGLVLLPSALNPLACLCQSPDGSHSLIINRYFAFLEKRQNGINESFVLHKAAMEQLISVAASSSTTQILLEQAKLRKSLTLGSQQQLLRDIRTPLARIHWTVARQLPMIQHSWLYGTALHTFQTSNRFVCGANNDNKPYHKLSTIGCLFLTKSQGFLLTARPSFNQWIRV